MARVATYKTIQTHIECACGYNDIAQEKLQVPHRELVKLASFKKRRTGNFYLILQNIDCKGEGHELY